MLTATRSNHTRRTLLLGAAFLSLAPARAQAPAIFKTHKVSDRVYALVGELGQRSPANLGNNMTCGFVIADNGVIVVDTGGSRAGAEAIVQAVRRITDKPVLWAVNTGGQDHRWLGNHYFKTVIGARVIAARAGLLDMRERTFAQVDMARRHVGERFAGTEVSYPDETFADRHVLPVQGVRIELVFTGGAHTRGDLLVWLPDERVVFTGDVVFAQRLLGIQPGLGLKWIAALERLRDEIRPAWVIPGHGDVSTLEQPLADSLGYLEMLRDGARRLYEAGAFDPVEVSEKLDQSRFAYLRNYDDARFRSENAIRMATEVLAAMEKK